MLGTSATKIRSYAVLPLRDIVVFPHMIVPLFVGREKSVVALENVIHADKKILLVTQKNPSEDDPQSKDLYTIGTVGTILQLLKLPDGTVKVLVEGGQRVHINSFSEDRNFLEATVTEIPDTSPQSPELEALSRAVMTQFEQYVKLNKKIPPEVIVSVNQISDPSKMADTIASHITLKIEQKQEILETGATAGRLEKLYSLMEGEIGVLQVEKRIRGRVKRQMEKTQREYYLNEQMKAIQRELNEGEDGGDELGELEKKIDEAKLGKEALERAKHELKKLRQMSPMSAEATVVRNYLDWILSVPWHRKTRVKKDIRKAKEILDKDHFGLEKVKERILEYLAVQHRTNKIKGPILCLVGPPGVGKTSLGQSVARATNRNFVRMSLGGVRDESEVRGHRRTYIGAMPGKIIQGMKKAKTVNPLFLLDEIDKLGADWRGDPSSALLEVLDPEQNDKFQDHYLELDYDLSDVMFVCTANTTQTMPRPLMDRMEIIRISGYTEDEKLEIVKRHILKKQMKMAGLKKEEFVIHDAVIRDLIRYYTREAGVRNLERELANLCRKAIKEILMKGRGSVTVTRKSLEKYAGVKKYRYGEVELEDKIGVVTGLAYTETGGDLLSIEAVTMRGKDGKVTTTGNLKDVMKESITVAEMLIKSRAAQYGLEYESLKEQQIHVHVPEGATPKDGPSAGAAMVTAIVSALTSIPIRKDIAMTGEVNLRGNVTAIGGLKEKLLAALRGGIKKVLIPKENEKDLAEIPNNVIKGLEIVAVSQIDEVLTHALSHMPEPLSAEKDEKMSQISSKTAENQGEDVIHH
ncbi:MAG: endopeptidase La [Alphaproteobacteria bacterium]|nr:endopeptidase La [Alphaproteobacteria bacterium]MBP7757810.1 endopeptidase La [Alphaproteobacteria bacterium]MBP7760990.1 endopeptidase La [Alphaproteobacteria bacterium]MBP7905918.1 endopeptidase La [Alphaproteobacteria bacterium]